MQSRHCGLGSGTGRVRAPAHLHLCLPLAKPAQDPPPPPAPRASRPLPPASPPLPRRGLERKLGALRGSADSGLEEGRARPRLPLESAASLAPGKFFKVPISACPGRLRGASRRRPARQPRRRRQPRALGDSLARLACSREAVPAPGGQALLPGRKPQLTQAARKAEAAPLRLLRQRRRAYTWGPDGRPEPPVPRCPRGRSARGAPGV